MLHGKGKMINPILHGKGKMINPMLHGKEKMINPMSCYMEIVSNMLYTIYNTARFCL